jgi:hypothetical protein
MGTAQPHPPRRSFMEQSAASASADRSTHAEMQPVVGHRDGLKRLAAVSQTRRERHWCAGRSDVV